MTRIMLISVFGALLAACTTATADQTAFAQVSLACADVGIDPGTPAFNQCVANLDGSLAALQTLDR